MNEREIRRHISRIRTLAMEWRAQPEPTIIPIHAQAAHLATLPKYSAESGKLHAGSRIDELQEYLAGEVIGHGEIRRVMMVVDGMAGSMDGISTLLDESIRGFGVASKFVHGQAKGFDKRCARFCTDRKREIADRCQDAFTVLKRRAANFVEDNIEKKNIEHRWKRMVSSCRSSLGLKNFQNS